MPYGDITERDVADAARRAADDVRYELERKIDQLEHDLSRQTARIDDLWQELRSHLQAE